mmetsp:Transcript_28419/g.85711  ORF Transcript_28419/g.85711 Transcript_28419/m.85711 type:complete len:531 (-) Transcript_28419:2026-3618(-)
MGSLGRNAARTRISCSGCKIPCAGSTVNTPMYFFSGSVSMTHSMGWSSELCSASSCREATDWMPVVTTLVLKSMLVALNSMRGRKASACTSFLNPSRLSPPAATIGNSNVWWLRSLGWYVSCIGKVKFGWTVILYNCELASSSSSSALPPLIVELLPPSGEPPIASWYCCMERGCSAEESNSPSSSRPSDRSSSKLNVNSGNGCKLTYNVPSTAEAFFKEIGCVAMAPSDNWPNSISSSMNSMFGTTAVATIGSRMGLPPRTFSVSVVSNCIGRSSNTWMSMSARPSAATRPRIGETTTPSVTPSTWNTPALLPWLWTETVRSWLSPTGKMPMSSLFEPNLRSASGAWPDKRSIWSSPSSILSVKAPSTTIPFDGGVKTTSVASEPPGRMTPLVGEMENEELAPCHENRAGALPGLESISDSVMVLSRLSSEKRNCMSDRDMRICTGVISALTSSLKACMPLMVYTTCRWNVCGIAEQTVTSKPAACADGTTCETGFDRFSSSASYCMAIRMACGRSLKTENDLNICDRT